MFGMAGTSTSDTLDEVRPRERRGATVALCLAGFIALMLLAGCTTARGAPLSAEVSGAVADGFGRLVFTFSEETSAEVRLANGIVIIGFKQPVEVGIEHLAVAMPGYVGVARRDPDGTAVRIALARKVTVNTKVAGEKLFIDLLPEGWAGLPPGLPQEVVDELARRAREAEKKVRQQQQVTRQARPPLVRVRVASLPTFTRYIFELPEPAAVTSDRNRDKLSLTFDTPMRFDLADAKAALPPTIASLDAETGADSVTVRFVFLARVDVRTFREDGTFVVDVSPSGARDRAAAAAGGNQGGESTEPSWLPPEREPAAPNAPNGQKPAPAATPAHAPPPQHVTEDKPRAGAPTAPPPASEPASTPPDRPPEFKKPRPAANAAPAAPPPAPAAPATPAGDPKEPPQDGNQADQGGNAPPVASNADPNAPVTVALARQGDTIRLVFPFRSETSAAVFRRADTLWLVFDSTEPLDVRRLRSDTTRLIRDVTVMPSGKGQAVRIRLERARLSSAARDDKTWTISLGDVVLEPTAALTIARAKSGAGHAVALIPFEEPQQIHRLADPDSGSGILVVTANGPARGFLKDHEFVEFRALASTHGVAIEPLADDIAAELGPERILISRPGGLALTTETAANGAGGQAVAIHRSAALDVQSWGSERQADFNGRQVSLMHLVADAPEGKRTAPRTEFARFYLARDMYAEAKGLLDVTLSGERDHREIATALVLRGIANLMLGREDLALKDLATPVVGNQHDAPLWRGIALSRQGRFAEAREGLKSVEGAMAGLPVELQRTALQEAARCALEVGDLAETARRLNEFEAVGIPNEMRAATSVLAGRLAESLNRPEDALTAYRTAAESTSLPAAMQGRLRALSLRYGQKKIKREEMIGELERLTAGWRGDETEVEAMQLLAHLYSEEGRFRDAFQVMRVALGAHPRSQVTRRIQDEAAATFDSIFLGDRGNGLSPVEALGLFYDFRMLTPAGRRGDEMIRRLVERLVAMDLLAQASELLQHQISHRLQGAARAQVAVRLAVVYLMNRKPDRALQALRATRVSDLPNELRAQRLLIEARALSELGRHDLALEIVEDMQGREVQRLRADIHWSARHWREAAEQIEQLYGERWREPLSLDMIERGDMLRAAIGYALAEDSLGVDRFREKYGPKMAESPDARMFEVVTAPLNARTPEFAEIARAASSVDTLVGFLRDLRARYPDPANAVSSAQPPGRG